MSLFDNLVRQRRFIYLVVALLSAAGIWAALQLPSAIYPELHVLAHHDRRRRASSLGARQVLFSITRPIEEAVSIVPGVTRVQSRSIRGGSEIERHVRAEHRHDVRAAAGAGAREPGAQRSAGRSSTSRSSG